MGTSEGLPATDEHAEPWLTASELASWLSVVRLVTRLPWALDAQLMREAGLSIVEYGPWRSWRRRRRGPCG